jgi:glutamate racemase
LILRQRNWSFSINNKKNKDNNQAIGVFDSGVGGLSVVEAINQLMPNENLIYVADSQFAPYGDKPDQLIESRVIAIADFFHQHNVKAIVVACNTATAAAIQLIRNQYDFPIIGLEPALKPAAEYTKNKKIGILATQSTLLSQKYKTLRSRFEKNVTIIEKASPLFVELVETALEIGSQELKMIKLELQPLIETNVDSLVLGCTHYPFLTNAIKNILGENIKLFDSGMPVAQELKRRLEENLNLSIREGKIQYYSSEPLKALKKFEQILDKKITLNHFSSSAR